MGINNPQIRIQLTEGQLEPGEAFYRAAERIMRGRRRTIQDALHKT